MQETLHYLLMSDHFMIQKALVSSVKDPVIKIDSTSSVTNY